MKGIIAEEGGSAIFGIFKFSLYPRKSGAFRGVILLMPSHLPPEIKSGLVSLRRRIRRIQLFRGLLRTFGVVLGWLLLIVALDYLLAPLPSWARAGLFFLWLAAIAVASVFFILRPMTGKLPLVRLARWLEDRHPEVQERISTALELSAHPEGISPALLAELSREAATDISILDPREEVQTKRVRRSMVPVGGALVALIALVAVWPQEMGRLLTRAVSPFTELGNAGAFRFEIQPGDFELLEGDELSIDLTYTGSLSKPLELVIEKDGETLSETLQPKNSDGDTHTYSYQIHSAQAGFKYLARVAGSESDRFEVKVYPLPRLLEPTVTLQYPPYTSWPDRKMSLGNGVQALAGTKVTVKGRFDTPLESGELLLNSEQFGEVTLEPSAHGTMMTWSEVLKPDLDGSASIKVKHRLGRVLDGAQFQLKAIEDPAPVVKILTPVQREFRVKPDEQVIITYDVIEGIGLSRAEIELEVNGKPVDALLKLLPERIDGEGGNLWEGEAMIFLGTLVAQHKGARQFRMRLALSDNRPGDLDGPGVGHSEWLEFKLDQNAESLVRQELKKQDRDIRETVAKAIKDINKAREKMHQAKAQLHKEEVSESTEKALAESRDKLKEAQMDLAELTERMKQGVQEHRRDEVEKAMSKLEAAKKSVESTPLQDTPESRQAEVDNALRESEEAIQDLQKFQEEVQKDHPKMEDLARLQEMAQRQEELARQAAEEDPDQDWKDKQRQMQEEIRQKVQQSPEAKAAAMKSQSEQAMDLSKEAEALQKSQEELAKLSEQSEPATPKMNEEQLKNALAQEQQDIATAAREELADAKRDKEARADELPKAITQAEKAANEARQSKPEEAAKSAQEASKELAKGADESASQKALQEKQEKLAEAFEALAEGKTEEAQAALEEAQAMLDPREIAKALAEEQGKALSEAKEELSEAKKGQEARAEDLPKAVEQAQQAMNEANQNKLEAAAEAARKAGEELAKGAEESPSQMALQKKQEKLAEAFEALAEGKTEEAQAALEAVQNTPDSDEVAKALARAQEEILEGAKDELSDAQKGEEARAETLPKAVQEAQAALNEAKQSDAKGAAEAAQKAAQELVQGAEESPSQEALQKQQKALAEAFEALAEGKTEEAQAALEKMQSERVTDALEQALAREQEAVVEGTQAELTEAREAQQARANDLPEALAQAQAALEGAQQGEAQAAAEAAKQAARELSKGAEVSPSQMALQEKQQEIAAALQDLAEGRPEEALAALEEMQAARAAELVQDIQSIAEVEGNSLGQAQQQATQGSQKASQATQSQQAGQALQASQQHEQAAQKFGEAQKSLEQASQQMAQKAEQAAQQSENPRNAPAPGESMAEALQQSAQAANAGEPKEAATSAQAAADALSQAAKQAKASMKQGGKPGDEMAQAGEPGEPGEGNQPGEETKEGIRQAQGNQGVPSELAKLGISASDWEKIQATMTTDVSGSRRSVIPEDYRGLVQKYFEQVSKKR
ncbi:MAG: hypothetical protein ACI9NQ_000525 [Paracoccaceae bacterium]